jgi:Zn finger protein HypA/HybF involved in hydrogenase expression
MEQTAQLKCKDCGKEIAYYQTRKYCNHCSTKRLKKQISESSIKRMIRNREFIKNYKKNKQCEICGYNKYPGILIFHHKNKEEKNKNVNILMKSLKNIDTIKKEIEKCRLLCANCHREIHLCEGRSKKNEK